MVSPTQRAIFHRWLHWLPAVVVAYLWIVVVGLLGNVLAHWSITLFTAGLLVVVPALLMSMPRAILSALLCGFLFDASLPVSYEIMEKASESGGNFVVLFGKMFVDVPVAFGFVTTWMIIFTVVLRFLRRRIDLAAPRQWLGCALVGNAVIFLFWAFSMGWGRIASFEYWIGFFVNTAFSSAVIALLGWWFFDAFVSLYRICGIDLVEEREVEE